MVFAVVRRALCSSLCFFVSCLLRVCSGGLSTNPVPPAAAEPSRVDQQQRRRSSRSPVQFVVIVKERACVVNQCDLRAQRPDVAQARVKGGKGEVEQPRCQAWRASERSSEGSECQHQPSAARSQPDITHAQPQQLSRTTVGPERVRATRVRHVHFTDRRIATRVHDEQTARHSPHHSDKNNSREMEKRRSSTR